MSATFQDQLLTAWHELGSGRRGTTEWRALRVAINHPLEVFAALREVESARAIVFECDLHDAPQARLRFASEGLFLTDERDPEARRARFAIALERPDLERILLAISEDLVRISTNAVDASTAVLEIGKRLVAWQACLAARREGFGREKVIGLFGELAILERLAARRDLPRALAAWTGPDRRLHDFESEGRGLEVKTSAGQGQLVQIGSLEQLDDSGLRSLALLHVTLVPDHQGRSIHEIAASLRSVAERFGHSCRLEVDRKLLMYGYLDQRTTEEWEPERFSAGPTAGYRVGQGFPRLTRADVPGAIVQARYSLNLAGCEGCALAAADLDRTLDDFLPAEP